MVKAKKKRQVVVPTWVESGKAVWVEIIGKDGEPKEYLQGSIKSVDQKSGQATIMYVTDKGPDKVDSDLLMQRNLEPHIVHDLCDVNPLNNAELLLNLESKYKSDDIFCDCGPTLLAMNPNKGIPKLYTDAIKHEIESWARGEHNIKPRPHIWTMSAKAYKQMFETMHKQACCISGESGAGKTYNTKTVMGFITKLMQDPSDTSGVPIEDRILACNPILEAFGNATTVRNDDSSRFGKYFEMWVNTEEKVIKGAKIKNYLLEKSRISYQAKTERNYHIFYALIRFCSDADRAKYKLNNDGDKCTMEKFNYLNISGRCINEKVDDEGFYKGIEEAFPRLRFLPEERDMVWSIVSATLNIGNWEIDEKCYKEGEKPCDIKSTSYFDNACDLLGLDKEKIKEDLHTFKMTIAGNETCKYRDPYDVRLKIDALAKDCFDKVFNWMVRKCNTALLPEEEIPSNIKNSFGLLDIFGFENFDMNSIEQFCINYTNEKLQYLYITYVFQSELKIFEEEGITGFNVVYTDNSPIIELMDKGKNPPGIFNLLDSNCAANKDDKVLLMGIEKAHGKNAKFVKTRIQKPGKEVFKIEHSARLVAYTVWGFTEKNKDDLPDALVETLSNGNPIWSMIFAGKLTIDEELEEVTHSAKEKYLGYKFRMQMQELMDELLSCECNFMRCLKGNECKAPNIWWPSLALKQLVYLGILDTINLRKLALPQRFKWPEFYMKFQDIDGKSEQRGESYLKLVEMGADFKTMTENVITSCFETTGEKDMMYGKTRIFMSQEFYDELVHKLDVVQREKINSIRTMVESFKAYKFAKAWQHHIDKKVKAVTMAKTLLSTWGSKVEYAKYKKLLRKVGLLQINFRTIQMRRTIRLHKYCGKVIGRQFNFWHVRKMFMKAQKLGTTLQNCKRKILMRRFFIRLRWARQHIDFIFDTAWNQIVNRSRMSSTCMLQRVIRGYIDRQQAGNEIVKLEYNKKVLSINREVNLIQKWAKGFLIRSRMDRIRRASGYIGGFLRMRWLRKWFLLQKRACIMIQRWVRKKIFMKVEIYKQLTEFLQTYRHYFMYIKNADQCAFWLGEAKYKEAIEKLNKYDGGNLSDMPRQPKKNSKFPVVPSFIPAGNTESDGTDFFNINDISIFGAIIDFDCLLETQDIYGETWPIQYLKFLNMVYSDRNRLMNLEFGDSFSLGKFFTNICFYYFQIQFSILMIFFI